MLSMKKVAGAVIAIATISVLSVGNAAAGPTATITIHNKFNAKAVHSSSSCLSGGSFNDINANSVETVISNSGITNMYSCSIKYEKSGNANSGRSCEFVVTRLTRVDFFSLQNRWMVPTVSVTRRGGAMCSYRVTAISDNNTVPNGSNGNFSVTLTMDEFVF